MLFNMVMELVKVVNEVYNIGINYIKSKFKHHIIENRSTSILKAVTL